MTIQIFYLFFYKLILTNQKSVEKTVDTKSPDKQIWVTWITDQYVALFTKGKIHNHFMHANSKKNYYTTASGFFCAMIKKGKDNVYHYAR